ncbi:hypothetical protein FOWG_13083 [Fusarium oxysporum f. sp. lycopersici MN25]|nr:hypothetical protein FOWG_13083 [Fusarium oxysporum f. sp. lycopersici MN25]
MKRQALHSQQSVNNVVGAAKVRSSCPLSFLKFANFRLHL